MLKWLGKYWWVILVIVLLLCAFALFPFILDAIFEVPFEKPINQFWLIKYSQTDFNVGDVLSFYGNLLVLASTVFLGVTTLYYSHASQVKNDEYEKLRIDLARKTLLIAETQFDPERNKSQEQNPPKLEIEIKGSSGSYSNLWLTVRNVSDLFASSIEFLTFTIFNVDGSVLSSSDKFKVSKRSLYPKDEARVECNNSGISSEKMDFKIEIKFSFEDQNSNTYFFLAEKSRSENNMIYGQLMKITRIG